MDFSKPSTHDNPERATELEAIVALNTLVAEHVNKALLDERNSHPPRDYLGGSRLGHPKAKTAHERGCERALYYEYKHYKSEKPFSADLYRVFDMGHDGEDRMAEYLRLAGFDLKTHKPDGGQFGFAVAPDPETGVMRVRGHIDGVIVEPFLALNLEMMGAVYPMLWENKAMNNSKWNSVRDKGVQYSHPIYYGQMQVYMGFMKLESALFTALNRNTGEVYYEIVRFNEQHAQASVDRGARVIDANAPTELPRAASDYTYLPCKWCSYAAQCRKDEEALAAKRQPITGNIRHATPTPDWAVGEGKNEEGGENG